METQLLEHSSDVSCGRMLGDRELRGDLAVSHAPRYQHCYLLLVTGELGRGLQTQLAYRTLLGSRT
jgi:hypothetical protein